MLTTIWGCVFCQFSTIENDKWSSKILSGVSLRAGKFPTHELAFARSVGAIFLFPIDGLWTLFPSDKGKMARLAPLLWLTCAYKDTSVATGVPGIWGNRPKRLFFLNGSFERQILTSNYFSGKCLIFRIFELKKFFKKLLRKVILHIMSNSLYS